MDRDETLKPWRIFVACPSDVNSARERLRLVIGELQMLARYAGVTLELLDWRQVVPDSGLPEEVILQQLNPTKWDIFVGILWLRFGSPTGAVDLSTGMAYESGTHQEFVLARRLWEKHQRPRILFYECEERVSPQDIDPRQLKLVREFLADFRPGGRHPGFVDRFKNTLGFERLVRLHLMQLLADESERVRGTKLAPAEKQIMAPGLDNLPERKPFFGRERELAEAMDALDPKLQYWGLVIDGIGGVGKTALAVEAANRCLEQGLYQRCIFVSAKVDHLTTEGIRESPDKRDAALTLNAFLDETARGLGRSAIMQLPRAEKVRVLYEEMEGSNTILIFDNLEELGEDDQKAVLEFLQRLPPGCRALATTRQQPTGAKPLRLSNLDWPTCYKLIESEAANNVRLKEMLGNVPAARWEELYHMVGGSPLALIWALGFLQADDHSLDQVLALLRQNSSNEIVLQRFIYTKSIGQLDETETQVLRALSLFDPSAPFAALEAVTELPRNALEANLDRLSAFALVDGKAPYETCKLHPLTRRYASSELKKDPQAVRVMGVRFAKYWLGHAWKYGGYEPDQYKTFRMLGEEWKNIQGACDWLWWLFEQRAPDLHEVGDLLNQYAQALGGFLVYTGRWDERIILSSHAYTAQAKFDNWAQAAWRAYDVAWIHYYRGETSSTEEWSNRCQEAYERSKGRLEQLISFRIQGLLAWTRKHYDEARRLLEETLKIAREMDRPEDIGRAHSDLGALAEERLELDQAEHHHRAALTVLTKAKDSEGIARSHVNLGSVRLARRQWTAAHDCFEKGLGFAIAIGRKNLMAQAELGLARVLEGLNRRQDAVERALKALSIYEELRHRGRSAARQLIQKLSGESPPFICG